MRNNMNKPVFIDFGCGPNMSYSIKYKLNGYYIVIIEKSEEYLYENLDMGPPDIEWFKMIADEISFFDITDSSKSVMNKADVWNCSSVLEHVDPHDIDPFLTGLKNNCKDKSEGLIHIDLTDHFGGFKHRTTPEEYNHFIKNFYQEKEWYEIIEKHFTIKAWHKLFWYEDSPDNSPDKKYYHIFGTKNKDMIVNSENCMAVDFTVYT
jgi:hypothetical protein